MINHHENENLKIYIDEYENEKLTCKIEKMSSQIKNLTTENHTLKAKVNYLEHLVENLCSILNIPTNFSKIFEEKIQTVTKSEETEETWLFWVRNGLTIEIINQKLNYYKEDSFIIEVNVEEWYEERIVFFSLLSKFTKFKEFSDEWSKMDDIQLKHLFQSILSSTMVNDTAIILRNLPSKNARRYHEVLSNIAMLAGLMFNTWEGLETENEIIGRIALVLESKEKLEILNIIKDDSRLILLVEPLFGED